METVLIYLAKSTAILLLFYVVYFFLLKKETFFSSNRWFLLLGIFSSIAIPFLTFQKTVWVEPVKTTLNKIDFNAVATTNFEKVTVEESSFSWEMLLLLIYGIGVLVFLSKLIIEFYSLRKIIKHTTKKSVDGFAFIEVDEAVSPFSFFKTIVYNPTLFQAEELDNIIKHEKIHAKQNHSVDVLITRIYCILFWWNPLVWIYKKAIIQNLEFIADHNALAQANDQKSYLLTLLKITTAGRHVAITNHFYQSLIKKRIVMLNKNQSNRWNSWKYVLIVPVLSIFVWQFQTKVVAQEKKISLESPSTSKTIRKAVTAKTSDTELQQLETFFREEHNATLKFSKVKRNKNEEIISLKAEFESNGNKEDKKSVYQISGGDAIDAFTIIKYTNAKGKEIIGFGQPDSTFVVQGLITTTDEEIEVAIEEINDLKENIKAVEIKPVTIVLDSMSIINEDKKPITGKVVQGSYEPNKKSKGKVVVGSYNNGIQKQENNGFEMDFKTSSGSDNISLIKEDKNIDYKKALIFLNMKIISYTEMEKINPLKIASVAMLTKLNTNNLIAKYGAKASEGVILIETMDYQVTISKEESKESTKNFKIDKENGGFTIHKRSQKSDFEFYEKYLSDVGVTAKISGIERNKQGFITAIKVKLIDQEQNHKMSENWVTSQNPNGIPDISIGRKNGKLKLKTL